MHKYIDIRQQYKRGAIYTNEYKYQYQNEETNLMLDFKFSRCIIICVWVINGTSCSMHL